MGKAVERVAVLASGGLDSCVLLAELAKCAQVLPIYIRKGLVWEAEERKALESFTKALNNPNVQATTVLTLSGKELYDDHWSVTGQGIPDDKSPSEAVAIPGRNILLIGLAAVWCSTHQVPRIAIGSLSGNPFPDATPQFFKRYGSLLSEALGHKTTIDAPFRGILKEDLIRTHATYAGRTANVAATSGLKFPRASDCTRVPVFGGVTVSAIRSPSSLSTFHTPSFWSLQKGSATLAGRVGGPNSSSNRASLFWASLNLSGLKSPHW